MIYGRYCLISPCRDEAEYADRAIQSVLAQTFLPTRWVIVDDGSNDSTPEILARYAAKHDFIRVLSRTDRGYRKLGQGVIDAFYEGYSSINPADYEFICKLDLDVSLPPTYFELLMQHMIIDPRIGTISGKPYFLYNGCLVREPCSDHLSASLTKFYRTTCFREIGGFISAPMWDLVDAHRCRMLGWRALSIDDPELRFIHLRPNIKSSQDWFHEQYEEGVGQYFLGTTPTYVLASAVNRFIHRPLSMGSLAFLGGYFNALARRQPRYEDHDFRSFLRKYHRQCLVRGKESATRQFDQRHQKIWEARASRRVSSDKVLIHTTA